MQNVSRKTQPFGWLIVHIYSLTIFFGLTLAAVPPAASKPQPKEAANELEAADQKYQEFLDQFYQQHLKRHPPAAVSEIQPLARLVAEASVLDALAAIRAHQNLLLQSITKKEFGVLLEYLYRNNDTATIQGLTEGLKKSGDPVALSRNYFLLARYYESRRNWRGVQAALGKVNPRDLDIGDSHYYNLLMGFALQNLKQHRKALKFYQQVPRTSPYFSHVKLNEGTAFLRQGWWTEAHLEFEKAIQSLDQTGGDDELRNRILVVLGYSQLNYEFYRDARHTFRKVALASEAMNKALMGIGLAAAYQKDFAGAANAFEILAGKTPADLSVDEAFLLLPVAQAEARDGAAAATAYQNAIRHYENKIRELADLQQKLQASDLDASLRTIRELDKRSSELYGEQAGIPAFLLDNYQNLLAMREASVSLGLKPHFNLLHEEYKELLQGITHTNIDSRIGILNSYLSQAKFGMAQLYDKP
jgi:hypothetical protein